MTGAGKVAARMGRKALMWLPAVVLVAGTGVLLPLGTSAADASPMHARSTLTVATTGSDIGNCRSRPCKTLGYALTQARPNNTIVIGPGTYPESGNANVVNPGLTGLSIRSIRSAARTVIDATGNANGILIEASGVSVTGLTVKNANLEGILAEPPLSSWPKGPASAPANISHVTIAGNVVVHNDRAYDTSLPPDCGLPQFAHRRRRLRRGRPPARGQLVQGDRQQRVPQRGGHPGERRRLRDLSRPRSAQPDRLQPFHRTICSTAGSPCLATTPARWPRAVRTPASLSPTWPGCMTTRSSAMISTGNGAAGLLDATPYPGAGSYDNLFAEQQRERQRERRLRPP